MSTDLVIPRDFNGPTIINAPLRQLAPHLETAVQCRRDEETIANCPAREVRDEEGLIRGLYSASYSDKWKRELRFPRAMQVHDAKELIGSICSGEESIDAKLAIKMLSVLYKTMSKNKAGENTEMLLLSCVDLFDPVSDSIGVSIGLKSVPRHPIIVAFAIKRLIATKVFTPAPSELIEACISARRHLERMLRDLTNWLYNLDCEDTRLFWKDRDEWASIYTTPESIEAAETISEIIYQCGAYSPQAEERRRDRLFALDMIRERLTIAHQTTATPTLSHDVEIGQP